jgi:branched-chain amino acid transport system ATP-binding protein
LIEQKARQTLKFADRACLLATGRMVTSGTASELARDSIISETFLGAGASEARHAQA